MRKAMFAGAALLALLAPAHAEDGCDKFAWSLAPERALFAAADKPEMTSGQSVPAKMPDAFVLRLQPGAQAAYVLPPERKPKAEHWFGGMLRLPVPEKAGTYQVTLSEEAWIDLIQDGHYAHAIGNSGRRDCAGLRKSVRFELGAGPVVLQISGAETERVTVAIRRVE